MDVVRFLLDYWRGIKPEEARRVRILTVTVLVLGALAGILNTTLLALINDIINTTGELNRKYIWIFLVLMTILPISKFFSETTVNSLFLPAFSDLMYGFMRKFMTLPYQQIERDGTDRYHAILNVDLRAIYNGVRAMVFATLYGTIIASCLAYLGWLSLPVFGFTLVFLVVGISTYNIAIAKGNYHLGLARNDFGKQIKYFRSIVSGINEFKLHRSRRVSFFNKMVEPAFESMTRHTLEGNKKYAIGQSLINILYFALMGCILFGSLYALDVERSVISGYALAVFFILGPLGHFLNFVNVIFQSNVSIRKLREVSFDLANVDTEKFYEDMPPLPAFEEIRVKDLFFHYGEREEAAGPHGFSMGPFDFSIRPGEVVIVSGGNGSGKTTFAKVLCGLYDPVSGDMYYNNILIDDDKRDQYRQTFSAVFVDFHLFEQLLGMDDIVDLDEKAQKYLEELQIAHKLTIKDGHLSTVDLSQGQRKRLALVVAFLEDRPVYIFDEWTTHQDPMLRAFFYEKILPSLKKRGKAVLVISHDEKFFLSGDRIVRLELGQKVLDVQTDSLKNTDKHLLEQSAP